ncbi:MAG TPA: tetratricopeptide repeat protein, partial [Chloroflexi bacterium]|nr:tetratricopeptide repeat protein [Chloroflexota bacterium]
MCYFLSANGQGLRTAGPGGEIMAEIALHEYVQQMKQLIEEGRYDEVVAHGRHILEQYPKYLEVYRVLGEAMLEAGKEEQAENMFLRVLSGDPENFVAHAGMSVIYDRRGELDKALWHMERAFEISPDNPAIRNELRRLYGRKSGVEPGRLDLTPAALARLYARGGHYRRAIEEFRALLEEDPDRPDLQVALAEALWRNEQRIQAEELCLEILEHLPFCLKANLILGEIYTRTGRKEGQECLAKAEALDPENRVAATLFGDASPLPLREVYIERLEYTPPEAERPAWMPEAATEIEVAAETQIEIPAWLEEISLGGEAPAAPEEGEKAEVEAEGGLEVPSWLTEPGLEEPTEEPTPWSERPGTTEPGIETPTEAPPPEPAEIPEWLREMAPPEVREEAPEAAEPGAETVPPPEPAEIPDWLKGMAPPEAGEEAPEAAEPGAEAVPPPEPAEIPDWLKEMAPPEAREEVAPPTPPAEETEKVPEWLAEAIPSVEEEAPSPPEVPAEEEAPEWLKEPPTPFAEAPAAEEPASETPEWLEGEGLPSGDEALAWLESLAKGKEEELRAVAQAEAEARFAEIVGKPRPTEEPTPEETPPPKAPTPPAEPEVPERPEQPVEAPPAEQAASETPEWLEGEGLPSGDEALAWLESLAKGKEEE